MSSLKISLICIATFIILLTGATCICISNPSDAFRQIASKVNKPQILDRYNIPLNVTYENDWNLHTIVALEIIPTFLQQSFILSEDKRFFDHHGVDWLARMYALWGNMMGNKTRGASTITEQVVQMLHVRDRNIWSKWLEGWEATLLERQVSKSQILAFYLNQVPYSKRNRGVVQGARYYFDRDIAVLTKKSMMALALIVKSPNRLNLHNETSLQEKDFVALAQKLQQQHILTDADIADIMQQNLVIKASQHTHEQTHFTRYVMDNFFHKDVPHIITTLDLGLQQKASDIVRSHLANLKKYDVNNAGLVILDNRNNEVLSWVVESHQDANSDFYDTIINKRQAGSTLKPFLYALDIERGGSAASIIDDSIIEQSVSNGMHQFNNYSNHYYGKVTLRQALANSLNTPAVRTINKMGVDHFLHVLHQLQFQSLDKPALFYGAGLSLGNGEVTLLELTRAFSIFTNKGTFRDAKFILDNTRQAKNDIFKSTTTSIINDILSDPVARSLEFSDHIVFDAQTAFKTGTSTDFRDAWIVGYNSNYVVGIWIGNVNGMPMKGITGSIGALPILQDVMHVLNSKKRATAFVLDSDLVKKDICVQDGRVKIADGCNAYTEYFSKNYDLYADNSKRAKSLFMPKISFPTNNLIIAIDPRVPRNAQKLKVDITGLKDSDMMNVYVNEKLVDSHWLVEQGNHTIYARIHRDGVVYQTDPVSFSVMSTQ